jgi:DNA-binding GntR family transcriptional regulator
MGPDSAGSASLDLSAGDERTNTRLAHDAIKLAIVSGELRPGDTIPQARLLKDLSISRTPVREAIRMLQAEGWLRAEPNKHPRVAPASPADIEQTYAMRIALESLAARIAVAKMTDDDVAELEQLREAMATHLAADDYDRWATAHHAFHRKLTAGAGSPISDTCVALADSTTRFRSLFLQVEPAAYGKGEADHAAIVGACKRRDAEEASRLVAKNLARAGIYMVAMLDPGYDPTPIRVAVKLVCATGAPSS